MPPSKNYFHQLDALRGIACIMVLVHHLVNEKYLLGPLGVRLFFVMTGFLLAGNLLQQIDRGNKPGSILTVFYQKRIIRILPVYFLAFGILWVLDVGPTREIWAWIATFSVNFYMGLTGNWPGNFSHYWFLATSEQMVLVLAILLLWIPGRYLVPGLVLCFFGALLHRSLASYCGVNPMMVWFSPLSSMDSIAAGALIGIFLRSSRARVAEAVTKPWVAVIAWICLAIGVGIRIRLSTPPWVHFAETFEALFFAWLILRTAIGFSGIWEKILTSPVLVYTGMISYGLYIFHPLVHSLVLWTFGKMGISANRENIGVILAAFAVSFIAATISWYLMEKPLASLKSKAKAS